MARQLASSILARGGVAGAWQRLRPPAGVILMCHSVGAAREGTFDPNSRWQISPAQLEMAIGCARQLGYRAATLDDLPGQTGESDEPIFVLTFDDGYADNLHAALPVCRRLDVPMTTYVTSGFVERRHTAWWHLFAHLIAHQASLTLALGDGEREFDCATAKDKQRAFEYVATLLTHAPARTRLRIVNEVDARYSNTARQFAQSLFLTTDELRAFAADELVTIGAHGVGHSAMSSLTRDQARDELCRSRDFLAQITGSKPMHLAYPFGTKATTGPRDFELAREEGFATAVTTRHGCLGGRDDAMALPRIPVFPDDTVSTMRCKLSGLTTALAKWRRGA